MRRCKSAVRLLACKRALAGVATHVSHEVTSLRRCVPTVRLLASKGALAGMATHVNREATFKRRCEPAVRLLACKGTLGVATHAMRKAKKDVVEHLGYLKMSVFSV